MTPDAVRAAYRDMLALVGEPVVIRRYTGAGADRPRFDADAPARVVEYAPDELVGGIQQGDRKLILLADDLIARQFPVPPRRGDKAVVRGNELNIEAVDDNSRRVAGVLIAYEIQVRG
ncbi:MAG: hypothetical protein AB7O88_24330 [Reyranellaceae bacterium]